MFLPLVIIVCFCDAAAFQLRTTVSHAVEMLAISNQNKELDSVQEDHGKLANSFSQIQRRKVFQVTAGALLGSFFPSASSASPTVKVLCDPSISIWKRDNDDGAKNGMVLLYLLGTTHISKSSAQLARQLVEQVHPNAVFLELDWKRFFGGASSQQLLPPQLSTASNKDRWILEPIQPEISPTRIIVPIIQTSYTAAPLNTLEDTRTMAERPQVTSNRGGGGWVLPGFRNVLVDAGAAAVGTAIRGMYQNLGKAGFDPGAEFVQAMEAGRDIGADIVLGDRDVQITLRRFAQALAVSDLDRLFDPAFEQSISELLGTNQDASVTWNPKNGDSMDESWKRELTQFAENLKSRDRVRKIMGQLQEAAPALVQVMLTERDTYMATGIDSLRTTYPIITAVVGMAHQDGIERNLAAMGWTPFSVPCPPT